MKLLLKYILILLIVVVSACDTSLEIDNPNDPDRERLFADSDDVEGLAGSLYQNIYQGAHDYDGIELMLATSSDNVSCSWGNAGMRDMSWEPRNQAWVNTPSYGFAANTKYLFDKMYSSINTSANIINAVDMDLDMGEREARIKAWCKFIQGVAYGNLALVFDRAFLVDETQTVDPELKSAVDYDEIMKAAIGYLEEALRYAKENELSIPNNWLGQESEVSNERFIQIINTHAARFLAYMPRNSSQLAAVDWNAVKKYADNGITDDFEVVNDNGVSWYAEGADYLTANGWGVTDMYVVNLMDPTQPQHWDDNPAFAHPPKSTSPADHRLETDFSYLASNWFQAARGYYHYSNYRMSRYDEFYVNATGPKSEIMLSENDMLRAEAIVYSGGSLSEAADIINAGTRITRGEMEEVGPDIDEIIQAIHHERHVEMMLTGMGLQFFEMRKLDLLQKGTPLHLPLPAETLQTLQEPQPYYTFGTVAKADGTNTSNGGWR
ncbi:hypothetical protein [Fulvivirga sediminis]|uniref:RagB/SusD family nutrient uptake outer membrane protein n=1 Tax=Fulvivirga sediminis TaxID=2803949 RepID=A0A937K077_9BACT|nr:hypothetical protein [Fulvivirga sediminis]MBL3656035.1 hypothetical protein [Fulvivirga sediminis]